MKRKQVVSLALLFLLVAGCLTGCGKKNGGGADNEFTYWLGIGESTEYYLSYEDNPVMKYVMEYKTFENSEGEQEHISITFQTPPATKESENFSTLLSTGGYSDVISLQFNTTPITDLYEEGIILDLTDYVKQYMPNYQRYIAEHPDMEKYMTSDVNGERKYLSLVSAADVLGLEDQFSGFCYRRDWLVKYGVQPETLFDPMKDAAPKANPNAGKSFSGYYSLDMAGNEVHHDTMQADTNGDSWVDDVVFPSGNVDPVYVSDWEWMFDIFQQAINSQGIDDGYVLSIYYPGYNANGDLVTGFGGGGPLWYQDTNGKAQFGATSDNFKTYLQCMNQWWKNGWIDQRFAERSGDMFYMIDDTTVRQGKVGLWMGSASTLDSRIQNDQYEYTSGAVVYGAASPINDIYGGPEQQLKIPTCMFQNELLGGGVAITDKASEKDIALLCRFLDYFYGEEGSLLFSYGLSAEQMAECQDETYKKYGLENGAYTMVDGKLVLEPILVVNDGSIRSAMAGKRIAGLGNNSILQPTMTPTHQHSREQWLRYEATGWFGGLFNSQMTAEDAEADGKTHSRVEQEYMYISVPQFIKGEKNFDTDWDAFCNDLRKRGCDKVTETREKVIQRMG